MYIYYNNRAPWLVFVYKNTLKEYKNTINNKSITKLIYFTNIQAHLHARADIFITQVIRVRHLVVRVFSIAIWLVYRVYTFNTFRNLKV